jgi:hypothetical protein
VSIGAGGNNRGRLVVYGSIFDCGCCGLSMKAQEIIIVPACLVGFRLSGVFRIFNLSPPCKWKEVFNQIKSPERMPFVRGNFSAWLYYG